MIKIGIPELNRWRNVSDLRERLNNGSYMACFTSKGPNLTTLTCLRSESSWHKVILSYHRPRMTGKLNKRHMMGFTA